MTTLKFGAYHKETISDKDFRKLSEFIYSNYGIKMPLEKKTMLEGRLAKRLRANQMSSYAEYCDYLFSEGGEQEIIHMINVVSTNKTDFFREQSHFEFLLESVLPEYSMEKRIKPVRIWSAASSSGEEPYTLAMVMSEHNRLCDQALPFSIFGTDISSDILQRAINGIYTEERVANIPLSYKKRYLMRNKDAQKKIVRIVPELRKTCSFERLNLMDSSYSVNEQFDIIFCRNVLIYFDRPTQEAVINKLCKHLVPGGYFFLGHSESAMGMDVPLTTIKPTVFRRK
jgi:chemotaxis protein methyltransferase CheR